MEPLDSGRPALTTDTLFSLLAAADRRRVLSTLIDGPDRSVETLAQSIVGSQREQANDAVERCCIQLHHNHLPKLANEQLVEYDSTESSVTLTATIEQVELIESVLDITERSPGQ